MTTQLFRDSPNLPYDNDEVFWVYSNTVNFNNAFLGQQKFFYCRHNVTLSHNFP